MGLFGKREKTPPRPTPTSDEEACVFFVEAVMESITTGVKSTGVENEVPLAEIRQAVTSLTAYAFENEDRDLITGIKRTSLVYTINSDTSLNDAEWGKGLFDDTVWVMDYREKLLAEGRTDLERQLSLLATSSMAVIKAGPRFEALMKAITQAARDYQDNPEG